MLEHLLALLTILITDVVLGGDNIIVLRTIIDRSQLSFEERKKALLYGIWGSILFRILFVFLAFQVLEYTTITVLGVDIQLLFLLASVYLLHLAYIHFVPSKASHDAKDGEEELSFVYRIVAKLPRISPFWLCVIEVEYTDIMFSLDNIAAILGISNNLYIIGIGVVMAVVMMRYGVSLLEKFMNPVLEKIGYIVIATIGLQMLLIGIGIHIPHNIHTAQKAVSMLFIVYGIMYPRLHR